MASPIFQFNATNILAAQAAVLDLANQCQDIGDNLQKVAVEPVENGAWIGEGATAYTEQMKLMLAENNQTIILLNKFQQELGAFVNETSDFIYAQRLIVDKGAEVN